MKFISELTLDVDICRALSPIKGKHPDSRNEGATLICLQVDPLRELQGAHGKRQKEGQNNQVEI